MFDQLEYATGIGNKEKAVVELAVANSPKRWPRGKILPSKRKKTFDLLEYATNCKKEEVANNSVTLPRKTVDMLEYAVVCKKPKAVDNEASPARGRAISGVSLGSIRRVGHSDEENITIHALQKSMSPNRSPKRRKRPRKQLNEDVVLPHPPRSLFAGILTSFLSTPFDDKAMLSLHKLKQGIPLPHDQYQGFQTLQSLHGVPIIPQKSFIKRTRAKQNGINENGGINSTSSAAISARVSSFLIEEGRKLINASSLPSNNEPCISRQQSTTIQQHGGGDVGSERHKDDECKRRSMVAKNVARGIQKTAQRAAEMSRMPKKAKLDAVALRALAALESSDSSGDEGLG
jgi:hypothetical protein